MNPLDDTRISRLVGRRSCFERISLTHPGPCLRLWSRHSSASVTPLPLTPELAGALGEALAKLTNKQIVLETRVDPKLIGGVVAQVGGTVLDGSLKTQLEELRRTLHDTRV